MLLFALIISININNIYVFPPEQVFFKSVKATFERIVVLPRDKICIV